MNQKREKDLGVYKKKLQDYLKDLEARGEYRLSLETLACLSSGDGTKTIEDASALIEMGKKLNLSREEKYRIEGEAIAKLYSQS